MDLLVQGPGFIAGPLPFVAPPAAQAGTIYVMAETSHSRTGERFWPNFFACGWEICHSRHR